MPILDDFDLLVARLAGHATAGYVLALRVRYIVPSVLLNTFDAGWVEHYRRKHYVMRDPTLVWGSAHVGALRWSQTPLIHDEPFFEEAAEFGMRYGVTVSHDLSGEPTIFRAARSDREFTDDEVADCVDIVARLHDFCENGPKLTRAQIEALRLVADGSRYTEVAEHLDISESALKQRLASARERLGARTTLEAIRRARNGKLI